MVNKPTEEVVSKLKCVHIIGCQKCSTREKFAIPPVYEYRMRDVDREDKRERKVFLYFLSIELLHSSAYISMGFCYSQRNSQRKSSN
jgi:hypothetical protein